VAKAYGLADGAGTAFYAFAPLGGTGPAGAGDMKRIKGWFRDGMDTAVGSDPALKRMFLILHIAAGCCSAPI